MTLLSKANTAIQKQANALYLKFGTHPDKLFQKLRLGQSGVKLDDNPKFFRWLNYVKMFRAKKGDLKYSEVDMFSMLSKSMPESDLARLTYSLRQVPNMKNDAEIMQIILLARPSHSQDLLHALWFKSQETPTDVFKMLHIREWPLSKDDPVFLQWLKYTNMYRVKLGDNSFPNEQVLHVLSMREKDVGVLFQTIKKVPGLKMFAKNMQTFLFRRWIKDETTPARLGDILAPDYWQTIVRLPKTDPRFQTLKAYTLQYAAHLGGTSEVEKAKRFFIKDNPSAAIVAAGKLSN